MDKNKLKNNILRFAIIPAFILCMCFLAGCNTANTNTFSNISSNMDKVINTINYIKVIKNSELIIDDFMDENEVYEIETNVSPALYEVSNQMNMYLTRLTLLNNSIYNTVTTNDKLNNARLETIAKAHTVKSLCEQCLSDKNTLKNKELDSLEELNNVIMSNCSRIDITKNEIKNNISQINEIKDNYSSKTQQLCTRYQKLEGSLNTRLTYYKNMISGLDNITSIILANCDCDDCMTLEETDEDKNLVETNGKDSVYEHNKMYRNIDTYENAGKDIYGINRKKQYNEQYINEDYYNQNPYYNGFNNGMGYNNIYGYGYNNPFVGPYANTPFGFRNGFMIPNINTFGIYKNIDTYKPSPNPYLEDKRINNGSNIENNISENTEKSNNKKEIQNPVIPNKPPKKFDKNLKDNTIFEDDQEDKFVSINPN